MKTKNTFIAKKYRSMLIGGTATAVLTSIMFMANALIAGIMLGSDAAAAVNLVLPAFSLADFFATLFAIGAPILYSNELGSFHKKEADRTFGTSLLVALITGIALLLVLLFCGDLYLHSISPGNQTFAMARDYLFWMKYAILLLPINELLSGMVYSDGDVPVSTVSNIVSGAGSILLSILLCHSMGTRGLGLASFISLAVSTAILFLHFVRKSNSLRLNLAFSASILKTIVKFSIVDASTYLFITVFTAVMNHYVAHTFGAEMLILVSVMTLIKEVQLLFDSIGETITPIMSMYLGEETYPGIREVWKLAGRTAMIESLLITLLLFFAAPLFVRFLGIDTSLTKDYASWGLRIMAITMIFTCRMYLDSAYYILADKVPLGMLVCALRDVAIPLPLAILGGQIGGIYGMFIGLAIAPALGYAISYFYVRIKYGKENYTLFLVDREKNKNIKLFELEVTPELIIQTRNQLEQLLVENDYPKRTVNIAMLLLEELLMTIFEKNQGKRILAECSVELGEHIRLIIKDDGDIFDLADTNRRIDSLRGYIVSSLTERFTNRRDHFISLSYNRNVFEI